MSISKRLFIFVLLLPALNCFSQEDEAGDATDVTKITILNPGISYEKRIGKLQTLYAQAFMNTSITLGYSDALGNTSSVYFDPALTLQYRFYYNSGRRLDRGKRTQMNSMNYLAAIEEATFSRSSITTDDYAQANRRPINRLGAAWGMQRNYFGRFSLDLNFGLGYVFGKMTKWGATGLETKTGGLVTVIGQLNLGIWINKRKQP